MKKMTCKQLGGVCDKEFTGNSFEEIAEQSKKHGMEMMQAGDQSHAEAMQEMRKVMNSPEAMRDWMEDKRKAFASLPDNN